MNGPTEMTQDYLYKIKGWWNRTLFIILFKKQNQTNKKRCCTNMSNQYFPFSRRFYWIRFQCFSFKKVFQNEWNESFNQQTFLVKMTEVFEFLWPRVAVKIRFERQTWETSESTCLRGHCSFLWLPQYFIFIFILHALSYTSHSFYIIYIHIYMWHFFVHYFFVLRYRWHFDGKYCCSE